MRDDRYNKMMELSGYSEEAAKLVNKDFAFSRDGKVSRKGLENLRNFFIEYGLIPKEKAPAIEKLYTDEFVR